ncbi:molybdate ABC transporter permease subunit, partial [Burkholderia gladioli]
MTRRVAGPLRLLSLLLAVYLCAPFLAAIPQIGQADWAGVDWGATWSAVGVSAGSATLAALLTLVCGVPLGYWLARSGSRATTPIGFIVQLPLALPPLTSGVLLLFLLGPYSPLGQWSGSALTDSFAGIVLAETFVAAPFLIVAARSAFAALDPVFEDVAATLGHRAGSRFFRVALPAAWPSIRAGLVLAWLRAFGEFGATVMVAYHPYSLPVYTYVVFGGQGLPAMMPLLLPTLAIAVGCAMLSVLRLGARDGDEAAATENGDEPPLA